MDQFRQVGEVVGSLKALMVLKHEISINQRQCCLLVDMMELAFNTISEEIRQNLRLDEKNTKWKALELPLKELHRVLKDAECYIKYCMDIRDWWGKAISLHMNRDCVELYIHNLLSCFIVVIEAIETASEISGNDVDDLGKRRAALLQKYDHDCDDPKFFLWKFGKQFLVTEEICSRLDMAWKEDRWLLFNKVGEKKATGVATNEQKLAELLLRRLNDVESWKKVMSSSILVGAEDYQVKRRLGSGHLKEIHWLGESFALRTFIGEVSPLVPEISSLLSHSHPNILNYLCAFYDEGRKEGYLVMDLMTTDLASYIKEHSGQRNRLPFSIPVAVDIMLQIARGMEYLHSKKIYHGDLNPSNILLKARNVTTGGFQAKVTGFGMNAIKNCATRSPKLAVVDDDIWLAPEAERGAPNTEEADVYSFGMLCFELLTGKVPFEDGHLQGEQMVRNIRAGERPLFSHPSPRYLVNLTKKCWHTNPSQRPSFSSICRILRYIRKILVVNPDQANADSSPPLVDYCDMESGFMKKYLGEGSGVLAPVTQIPFEMVAYKVVEKEKTISKKWDLVTEGMIKAPASIFDEDQLAAMDDLFLVPTDRKSFCLDVIDCKSSVVDVDLRTVISETMQRKLHNLDSFVPDMPRKRYSIAPPPVPETMECESPEFPEKKHLHKTMSGGYDKSDMKKFKNIKTKLESPKPPMSSPGRAKKVGSGLSAGASPSRVFSKTSMLSSSPASSPSRNINKTNNDCGSPKREMKKSQRGGMNSPAREFKSSSSMLSPLREKKGGSSYSPAASPSRVYNVCDSPIHPSTYQTYPSSRLGRTESMPPTTQIPNASLPSLILSLRK